MARAVQTSTSSRNSDMSLSDTKGEGTEALPRDVLSTAEVALSAFELLQKVSESSKNLKGTYIKFFKDIKKGMKKVVKELASRNATDEVVQFKALAAELRRKKEDWKQKFVDLENKMERFILSQTTTHKQLGSESARVQNVKQVQRQNQGLSLAADKQRQAPRS